ncbi:MAG TPA: 7-cyano-7-deazaguanine synthase QueC [Bacteroidales bacterium]|jgi:7-cyano-7-deazaguanine synthase|nr:7-cyano-7-deazaguanine synthase QueC [Bacteroidales bacterium]
MNSNSKALVLLSGGQDSSTVLFWAKKKFAQVESIGFNYGQKHKLELEVASGIATIAKVNYYIAEISTLPDVSKNALTSSAIDVEKGVKSDAPPNTLVEGRNLLFLTYAAIYAKKKHVNNLVMGVGQTDYSGYPDCRNEFIQSAQQTISLATDFEFSIHTPLMWKNKAETWQLADELGVLNIIRENTLTCYNGIIADGCGKCPACILRKRGLDEYLDSTIS